MRKEVLVLGINGSPHKHGVGARLLRGALKQARKEGAWTKIVHLGDWEREFFHGNYTKRTPAGMKELFDLVERADGIIFSSPVHWFNVSSLIKNFIDQLTVFELRDFGLEGKVASVITTCEEDGGQKAAADVAVPLLHMGFILPPYATLFYNLHSAKKSEDNWQNEDARLIGGNLVKMIKVIKDVDWDYRTLVK